MPTQTEIRDSVTNQILAALENGTAPWRRPWSSSKNAGYPKNVTGRIYSGVNPILLWLSSMRLNLKSRYWATFRQWQEIGCSVKARPQEVPPGQWGTTIVFSKPCNKRDENGNQTDEQFWVLKTFVVFNADQVDGAEKFQVEDEVVVTPDDQDHPVADQLVANTKADIRFGGDRAFYQPESDFVQMPHRQNFKEDEYYPTLFHELTHWSENRLKWDRKNQGYAMGELIAELASCYVCAELGIPINQSLDNHAAYLKSWIEQMKGDSRYIFRATSQASKATDFLLGFHPSKSEEREPAFIV